VDVTKGKVGLWEALTVETVSNIHNDSYTVETASNMTALTVETASNIHNDSSYCRDREQYS